MSEKTSPEEGWTPELLSQLVIENLRLRYGNKDDTFPIRQLAAKCGLDPGNLSNLVKGERNVGLRSLALLLNGFNLEPHELFAPRRKSTRK